MDEGQTFEILQRMITEGQGRLIKTNLRKSLLRNDQLGFRMLTQFAYIVFFCTLLSSTERSQIYSPSCLQAGQIILFQAGLIILFLLLAETPISCTGGVSIPES